MLPEEKDLGKCCSYKTCSLGQDTNNGKTLRFKSMGHDDTIIIFLRCLLLRNVKYFYIFRLNLSLVEWTFS